MRYRRVCVEAVAHTLPPHVVSSVEIERRLTPVYERLGFPHGRLELMTGIRERRFFNPGTKPGEVSCETALKALAAAGLERRDYGLLLHGSVCRDQMEPATACRVHQACRMPAACPAVDVSNACLGLLSGLLTIADQIELGRIRAGIVVGTETGRDLVESTVDWLANDPNVTRNDVKKAFASLTIGSGSAAIVLCDESISRRKAPLLGGAVLTDTSHNKLCTGGTDDSGLSQSTIQNPKSKMMQTDSEALLHAGVNLATATWDGLLTNLGWSSGDIKKVVTHQVGKQHRKLLLERLGLSEKLDYPTVEFLGNTGAVALPTAASLAIETGHIQPGDTVALLGIGSGLSCTMLGMEWR
jgi:3-oxoacyl-[acyl-carrier-protein] synthase III